MLEVKFTQLFRGKVSNHAGLAAQPKAPEIANEGFEGCMLGDLNAPAMKVTSGAKERRLSSKARPAERRIAVKSRLPEVVMPGRSHSCGTAHQSRR